MNNLGNYDSLIAHLHDLKEKSERWHKSTCSAFLTEEEQAIVQKIFTPSRFVRYDGGYEYVPISFFTSYSTCVKETSSPSSVHACAFARAITSESVN